MKYEPKMFEDLFAERTAAYQEHVKTIGDLYASGGLSVENMDKLIEEEKAKYRSKFKSVADILEQDFDMKPIQFNFSIYFGFVE